MKDDLVCVTTTDGDEGSFPESESFPEMPPEMPPVLIPGEICPTCDQKVRRPNPHRMDAAKVRVLHDIHNAQERGNNWVQAQEDTLLRGEDDGETYRTIKDSRVHAQRLRYFKLLKWKERRSGAYQLTDLGRDFLEGRATVPERVWCRDGGVIHEDSTRVGMSEVEGVILDRAYWDAYPGIED